MPKGPLAAAGAYILWGVFPLYIKQVAHVPALEIVVHRSVWSLVFVFALLAVLRRFAWLGQVMRQPRVLGAFLLSALLLSCNWLLYVWAVNQNRLLDASLGYFINPLFNVMLGYVVLKERPRPWQWAAVGLAGAGVLWLTVAAGQLPWVSLALAASFGVYGLLRKTAALGAMEGLALETLLLAPLTVGVLVATLWRGEGAFAQGDWATDLWLLAAGPFTAIPLLLFAAGARRVTMATLGLLQYLGPSIQFVLGVWLYHEPFSAVRGVGFGLIWAALVLYSAEGLWRLRRGDSAAPAAT
ncbi:EamA family transporter RarD [Ideonella sp. A 288]|uniref:EamA family transporter RarD n=1 Tax=Ideonella sp. A 288 TaxID=1962181 RepID=UPI000B4AD8E1|nr:EamA family transporter RarD [Ideonella sp. A 288]